MEFKVFTFYYNSCIHESAPSVMSYHKSKEGAEKAMTLHREQERIEYEERFKDRQDFLKDFPHGCHESWRVVEETIKILD